MEPVTMIESRLDLHTLTNRTPSSLSPPSSSASRPVNSKKGRKSPVPKLLSEMELKSQNWGWIDWLWWTAFNGSIGKLLYVFVRLTVRGIYVSQLKTYYKIFILQLDALLLAWLVSEYHHLPIYHISGPC